MGSASEPIAGRWLPAYAQGTWLTRSSHGCIEVSARGPGAIPELGTGAGVCGARIYSRRSSRARPAPRRRAREGMEEAAERMGVRRSSFGSLHSLPSPRSRWSLRPRHRGEPCRRTAPTTRAASATSCRPARRAPTTPPSSPSSRRTAPTAAHWTTSSRSTTDLLYASPTLTHDDRSPKYFKDATFGVKPGDVESTIESPRAGRDDRARQAATASRTSTATRATTSMFGAGYAGAAGPPVPDGRPAPHRPRRAVVVRRRLGRQPRDGPHAVGDRALHRGRPAEADRPRADSVYGAAGTQVVERRQRVRRRHQRRTSTRRCSTRPSCRPSTPRSARLPQHWTADRRDRRGVADRRHLRQGRRQRGALGAARCRRSQKRFGDEDGPPRVGGLPLQERPRGADHGPRQALPLRDGVAVRRSAASRCPTRAR